VTNTLHFKALHCHVAPFNVSYSFINFWHHAPLGVQASNVDISHQSRRFWAMSVTPTRERILDFRCSWI